MRTEFTQDQLTIDCTLLMTRGKHMMRSKEAELNKCIDWFERWKALDLGDVVSALRLMILLHIAKKGGTNVQQGEVFKEIDSPKSSLSRVVSGMIDDGWITSEIDPENRSRRLLSLTAEGWRIIKVLYF